ncbi:MAG: ABC transporter permease [Cyclobacteriaceae bacterium]
MSKPQHIPPRLAEWLLTKLIRSDLQEEVLGDLDEKFLALCEEQSIRSAKLNYWYQVLNYLRPFAIRKKKSKNSNITTMFVHNIILSLRNFSRFKTTFFINLVGLSTALASVLFIYLWINDEIQMDHFHANDHRLYQIKSNQTDASGTFTWKGVPGLLLEEIQSTVPEVDQAAASTDPHEYTLSIDDRSIKAQGKFASEDYLDIFSFPLIAGNTATALSGKDGILITEELAERLFRSTDVLGETIKWHFWNNTRHFEVVGILKNLPKHTSEPFDFVLPWNYFHDDLITYKNWYNYYARIMLTTQPEASVQLTEEKINAILKENQKGQNVSLFLANYGDQYLFSKYENGEQAGGRIEYVYLFVAIASFILIIACINFVNLSTARASKRTKEIGIKKSMGASRLSLIGQFFTESTLLTLIALIIALGIVAILLEPFNFLTQKSLALVFDGQFIGTLLCVLLLVTLLAGVYPSLYLSSFKVVQILKGQLSIGSSQKMGRASLVVAQFSLSMILIVAVMIVYQQMDFVKNKNLGYNRDNVLYFEREGTLLEQSDALVAELKQLPGVLNAAPSGFMVGGGNSTGGVGWPGKTDEDQIQFWETRSGVGTIDILNIEILEGRDFSEEFSNDSSAVIFNETAIAAMNMTDPIGKTITHYTGEKKIIGVVKDFNLISLHTAIEPMIFLYEPGRAHFVMVKLEKGNEPRTIEAIEKQYQKFNPDYPFKAMFLDQDYQAQYQSEERVSQLSKYFAGLAILISCLGVFGLTAFTTERRTKEIGIRKVLGSGNFNIMLLIVGDMTKTIGLGILIAIPLSYLLGQNWLENFAYHIDLSWWYFAFAGIAAIGIAWLTMGFQTIKAASGNPVDCLRDE